MPWFEKLISMSFHISMKTLKLETREASVLKTFDHKFRKHHVEKETKLALLQDSSLFKKTCKNFH